MAERINDPIFGEMEYQSSWVKKETLELWGQKWDVEIIAHAYEGDEIAPVQRDKYKEFLQHREKISEESWVALFSYYKEQFETIVETLDVSSDLYLPENITKVAILSLIRPEGIIFMQDGESGILCDCKWERDDGLVIKFGDKIEIGTQDMIL